jgi:hypothetical protein
MADDRVNRDWVLHNLREALDELQGTIDEIESDAEYGYGEFSVAMRHIYHHLNTAWNSRDESFESLDSSDEGFYRYRAFPRDLAMD